MSLARDVKPLDRWEVFDEVQHELKDIREPYVNGGWGGLKKSSTSAWLSMMV